MPDLAVLEEEVKEACDFLHVGSGWRSSSVSLTSTVCDEPSVLGKVQKAIKVSKTHDHTGQGRGCNRTAPYTRDITRDIKRLQGEIHEKESRPQVAVLSDTRSREPSVAKNRQADFDSLSLGPGCPWLESVDLHI